MYNVQEHRLHSVVEQLRKPENRGVLECLNSTCARTLNQEMLSDAGPGSDPDNFKTLHGSEHYIQKVLNA